jgi:hypothetical protein
LIGRSWKALTNLTVIVPQVYNIEKLCFIYIKCERSELLADISRYSGILDNNLLLSRTEFLRHFGSKIRNEITWLAKIIHWIILPSVCTFQGNIRFTKEKSTYSLF